MTTATRDDRGVLRVLEASDIDAMPWYPLHDLPGVDQKVLWQSGETVVGLIRLQPGAVRPPHTHLAAHHHMYVAEGSVRIAGHALTAGAYVHIPPGKEHGMHDVGPAGCLVFYTHRPVDYSDRHHEFPAAGV